MTARTITTAAELDALPWGAVVARTIFGEPGEDWHKRRDGMWLGTGGDVWAADLLAAASDHAHIALTLVAPVVPVVSDAAVRVVADEVKAHYGPLGDPDEGTLCNCGAVVAPVGEYGVRAWREHVAGSVLDAVLPLLGAAQSATREGLLTEPHDGHEASVTCPGCPHDTPRTDR